MKYLNNLHEYLFSILESNFYMSPKMVSYLRMIDDPVSSEILSMSGKDVKPDMTFIDLSDKGGFISFSQEKNAEKLFKSKFPDSIDMWEDSSRILSVMTFLYDSDINNTSNSSGIFKKSRNQIKIGKLVNKMFPGKFSSKEIEIFVNKFKSMDNKETERLELVSGKDIAKFYKCENYEYGNGPLSSSCMKNSDSETFRIYTENPEVVRMLILKNLTNNKIKGRAIVWKIYGAEFEYFMDRVYTDTDSDINKFHKFAEENGWAMKEHNNYHSHQEIEYNNKSFNMDIEVQLGIYNGGYEYKYYPYMDTFTNYDPDTGILYNNDTAKYGKYTLDGTNGADHSTGGVWSDYYDEEIPEGDAVYSSYHGTYLYGDRSTYVERGNYSGWYSDDDIGSIIFYENELDEYVFENDLVFSETLQVYIYIPNSIYVISKLDKNGIPSGDYIRSSGDDYYEFKELEKYFWFKIYKNIDTWNNFDSISKELCTRDYLGNIILDIDKIITFKTSDGWLSNENIILLKSKKDKNSESRIESKLNHYLRIWINGDINPYLYIEDLENEIKNVESDKQIDIFGYVKDLSNLKKSLKKFKELTDYMLNNIEININRYPENISSSETPYEFKLLKFKVASIFGHVPNIEELKNKLVSLRKVLMLDILKRYDSKIKSLINNLIDTYGVSSKYSVEDHIKSFKFVFLYVVPYEKSKNTGDIKGLYKSIFGKKIDWDKDLVIGYKLYEVMDESIYDMEYNSSDYDILIDYYNIIENNK